MKKKDYEHYIYKTMPIDYFAGCVPIEEAVKQIYDEGDPGEVFKLIELLVTFAYKLVRAHDSDWPGDIRGHDLYVFAVPDEVTVSRGLILKQDTGGTTYICSPYPLPWVLPINSDEDPLIA